MKARVSLLTFNVLSGRFIIVIQEKIRNRILIFLRKYFFVFSFGAFLVVVECSWILDFCGIIYQLYFRVHMKHLIGCIFWPVWKEGKEKYIGIRKIPTEKIMVHKIKSIHKFSPHTGLKNCKMSYSTPCWI